jgi:hypothetical protein
MAESLELIEYDQVGLERLDAGFGKRSSKLCHKLACKIPLGTV